ncbi:ABC transporter ATP-binding protein [Acidaminococcus fermentans]|uniref:ABC transporter ATP-binding protein n=1 Tax=Acidaminococcus fermentans TaxID=905 RepID=UPI003D092EA2
MFEGRIREVGRPDRILSYFVQEKAVLLVVTVTGILYNLGMGAGPYFEGQLAQCLYDIYQGEATAGDMARLAALYVGVIFLVQLARAGKRYSVRLFANRVSRTMRHTLYHSLVRLDAHALQQENLGNLMTKAMGDVDACAEGMRKFTTEVFDTGVVMVVYLSLLLAYDWRLTLLACLFTPAAYWIANRLKKQVARANGVYKATEARLNTLTLDRVSHALTYRIYGQESRRDAVYENQLTAYEKASARANIFEGALGPLYDAIAMAGTGMIFWFGAKNVQGTGWEVWNIASFTTFLACFTKLAVKTSHAAKLFNAVQKAQVSWQRIKPLLRQAAPEQEEQLLGPVEPVTLEIRDLSCHYPGQENGLEGISFTARPGDIIGITGPVACGKSLLGKVFLDEVPWTGSIRCNGRDFSALDGLQRRSLISYLGHDPELLTTSIGENIRMGDPVEVEKFLAMTNLAGEVAAMPQGADTPVGSGGTRLSGGQQARIALARTLAHARSILVLDDPFAAVDRKGETKILDAMRKTFPDRVILLISHRLTHFPEFTGVLFLEKGRGKFGTHDQLLQEEPGYARLVQLQQEGVDLDEQ